MPSSFVIARPKRIGYAASIESHYKTDWKGLSVLDNALSTDFAVISELEPCACLIRLPNGSLQTLTKEMTYTNTGSISPERTRLP
jgi:hypothetical protein